MHAARRLTNLRRVSAPHEVPLSDGLLDAVDLVLVALAVAQRAFLRLLQRLLERLDALHRGAQALLQLRQLTTQVSVVAHQLQPHTAIATVHTPTTSTSTGYRFIRRGRHKEPQTSTTNIITNGTVCY